MAGMKKIYPISQAELRALFDYEPSTGVLRWRRRMSPKVAAGQKAGTVVSGGYLGTKIYGHQYLVHRLIWLFAYGVVPSGQIDHADGDRLNNRLSNLRLASAHQNGANRKTPKTNTSGFKGVRKRGDRWRAEIEVHGRSISLGTYGSGDDASAAYYEAAQRYFGSFARAS
jgi:hypothetical protein